MMYIIFLFIFAFSFLLISFNIGEGNGTPLWYSCLENPVDGRLAEALATVRAAEGLLARVGVEMLHQGGAPGETLPAHVAAMPPVGSGDRGMGREWRTTPARYLRWLLPTIRKASREGFESRQPGKLSVHRRNLPQCLPPSSLSFFCLVFRTCWETRGELRPQLILVLDAHTHYGVREAS